MLIMETSIFFAQAFGLYFVLVGLSMFRVEYVQKAVVSISENSALRYVAGLFTVVLGIVLVLSHNIWNGELYQILITAFSWSALLKGSLYLVASESMFTSLVGALNKKEVYFGGGAVSLVLGIWFLTIGF
jgi:hypothetical protein